MGKGQQDALFNMDLADGLQERISSMYDLVHPVKIAH